MYQSRLEPDSKRNCRAGNRLFLLQTREARHEIVPMVQSFRQATKLSAFPEVIRTHGQDHIHGHVALFGCGEEQLHEERALVAAVGRVVVAAVVENLLELVDHDEESLTGGEPLDGVGLQVFGFGEGAARAESACEFLFQLLKRSGARAQNHNPPVRLQAFGEADAQHGHHAGPDERALAAARYAGHGDKAAGGEQLE